MLTGIGHLAFYISDLQKSLDFYCQKLGLKEAFRLDREGTPSPWIVYLQVSPGNFIELFPGGAGENRPRGQNVGYNHLCLLVDDMAATLQELKGRGVEITGEAKQGIDHNLQYWLNDPDGNAIELMQIVSDSPHAQADARWQA
ncbi:lactoylglutathione lyase [Dictyobacter sp. S3.2.2.5]|uniref:Lactoylglutathione lyase n=1 Tax=Dictyobacter halimunensis TaxID=3026934 RepID=A0ABQ6FHH7_9CHLR|nr:lactoylglutathione lyase [Dictyobacter sp. S3.2.2.5]